MTTSADSKPRRSLDSLTGLRFIAAFAVFAFHAVPIYSRFTGVTKQGLDGVSFFFVLSGFVLTWSRKPNQSARTFYRNRAARILPAYYVAAVAGIEVCRLDGTASARTIVPGFFLIQSWWTDVNVAFGGNGVGWSLADEAFFYALFPFILMRLIDRSARAQWLTMAALVVTTVGWDLILHPANEYGTRFWAIYVLPAVRLSEFVIGMLLAMLVRDQRIPRIPLSIASVVAAAAYLLAAHVPLYARLIAITLVPFMFLIVAAAQADINGTRSPLRWRPLVRLGTWSYCFYLTHQLCIHLVNARQLRLNSLNTLETFIVSLLLALLSAMVLCEYIEKPLERRWRGDHQLPVVVAPG